MSLFYYRNGKNLLIVLVYVNDILITRSDTSEIQIVIDKLRSKFTLKELGSLSYFLGIKVKRDKEGMHLTLTKYIQDLLKKTNMLESKGSPTPISTSVSIG